jgi:hypothetical protein
LFAAGCVSFSTFSFDCSDPDQHETIFSLGSRASGRSPSGIEQWKG